MYSTLNSSKEWISRRIKTSIYLFFFHSYIIWYLSEKTAFFLDLGILHV